MKRGKDILQAESILTVLEDRMPQLLADAWRDLPWKEKAEQGMLNFSDAELAARVREIITAVA